TSFLAATALCIIGSVNAAFMHRLDGRSDTGSFTRELKIDGGSVCKASYSRSPAGVGKWGCNGYYYASQWDSSGVCQSWTSQDRNTPMRCFAESARVCNCYYP
ncbi:hypothetical protein BGW38_005316, partial [Lunasporangiospora selenospora]